MKKSEHYETVKSHYEHGLWDIAKVRRAVKCKWITAAEYQEITGEEYGRQATRQ